jgi:acyl-CoA thioesterase I
MRCLRCALDYGPDERYCRRCGRSLSKPIGAQREPASARQGLQDTASVYSTFSPPAVEDVRELATADDAISYQGDEQITGAHASWEEEVPSEEEDDPWAGDLIITPPDDDLEGGFEDFPREVRVPVNDEDDALEGESNEAPAVVEHLDDARQRGRTPVGTQERAVLRALIPAALLALLLVAGIFAWNRHASYANDISSAQTLQSRGQYQPAIDAYQQAINVWPLNDDARKGRMAAVAALANQQAAATATAVAQQAHMHAEIARGEMIQARQAERRASARQFDAAAPASPTTQQGVVAATTAHAPAGAVTSAVQPPARIARLRTALQAHKPLIYAAIGASETVGVGAADPATQSWVADLARKLPPGSRLVNLGKSGALLPYGVQTEMAQAIAANPDVITVWMAVNDLNALLKSRPTAATFEQQATATYRPQLVTLLHTLHARTRAAIFVGNIPDLALEPAYRSQGLTQQELAPYITAFNRIIAGVARTNGATLVNLYSTTRDTLPAHPEYVSGDGFHPSTSGYAAIAAVWWQAVHGTAQGAH